MFVSWTISHIRLQSINSSLQLTNWYVGRVFRKKSFKSKLRFSGGFSRSSSAKRKKLKMKMTKIPYSWDPNNHEILSQLCYLWSRFSFDCRMRFGHPLNWGHIIFGSWWYLRPGNISSISVLKVIVQHETLRFHLPRVHWIWANSNFGENIAPLFWPLCNESRIW